METMISVNGVKMTVRQFHSQPQYDSEGDELILIGAGTMKLKDFRVLSPEQQDILDVRPNIGGSEDDG